MWIGKVSALANDFRCKSDLPSVDLLYLANQGSTAVGNGPPGAHRRAALSTTTDLPGKEQLTLSGLKGVMRAGGARRLT
jgi:hypothetical protein